MEGRGADPPFLEESFLEKVSRYKVLSTFVLIQIKIDFVGTIKYKLWT
jgi:hypothetical protein